MLKLNASTTFNFDGLCVIQYGFKSRERAAQTGSPPHDHAVRALLLVYWFDFLHKEAIG